MDKRKGDDCKGWKIWFVNGRVEDLLSEKRVPTTYL